MTSHQFNPSPYFNQFDEDRIKLHNEVEKLNKRGWGYTKIHTHLINKGFKIGKSRTCVYSILEKMKKRNEFYNQPIMDGIGNFRIKMKSK